MYFRKNWVFNIRKLINCLKLSRSGDDDVLIACLMRQPVWGHYSITAWYQLYHHLAKLGAQKNTAPHEGAIYIFIDVVGFLLLKLVPRIGNVAENILPSFVTKIPSRTRCDTETTPSEHTYILGEVIKKFLKKIQMMAILRWPENRVWRKRAFSEVAFGQYCILEMRGEPKFTVSVFYMTQLRRYPRADASNSPLLGNAAPRVQPEHPKTKCLS